LDLMLPRIVSQLGSPLCIGDATNLFFVPSESFDLAFTGYIDPLEDALNLQEVLGHELINEDLCGEEQEEGDEDKEVNELDWALKKLNMLDQEAQEDWHASWVSELIRIAKKGKPIIIEEVAHPRCNAPSDWGGVSKEWWTEVAVSKYGWDVDVNSIYIENMMKTKGENSGRYIVYMEKNAPR